MPFSLRKRPCAAGLLAIVVTGTAHAATPLPAKPVGRPGDWVTDNDYPTTSLQHNSTGIVGFVLAIDPAGVPSGCEIAQSSRDPDLDKATCDLMIQRARFTPATDATGKPTTGTYRSSIRWQIPHDPQPVPETGKLVVAFDVMADGSTANCIATASGAALAKFPGGDPQSACQKDLQFQPPRDASGNPVKKHLVYETVITATDVP